MNIHFPSKEALASFFKTGLLIMSASLLLTIVLKTSPELRSTSSRTVLENSVSRTASPIRKISTDSPRVVLSFNTSLQTSEDRKGLEEVQTILSILKEQDASAIFFLSDAWIQQYPEEVQSITSAGHEIGYLLETDSEKQALNTKTETITDLAGTRCCYVRPSLGEYDEKLLSELQAQSLSCVLWNMDSQDWKDYDAEALTHFLLQQPKLEPGSILLFRCGTKHLPEALPFIIQGLRDMGYEPASLSSLLNGGA